MTPAWKARLDAAEILAGAAALLWGVAQWSAAAAACVAGAGLIASSLLGRRRAS